MIQHWIFINHLHELRLRGEGDRMAREVYVSWIFEGLEIVVLML